MTTNECINKAIKASYPKAKDDQIKAMHIQLERKLRDVDIESEYEKIQTKSSNQSARKRALIKSIYELATSGEKDGKKKKKM